MIPDINLKVDALQNVRAEVFSRIAKDSNSEYYGEFVIDEETIYQREIKNPENQTDIDLFFYLIIQPYDDHSHFDIMILPGSIWSLYVLLAVFGTLMGSTFICSLFYCYCVKDSPEEED